MRVEVDEVALMNLIVFVGDLLTLIGSKDILTDAEAIVCPAYGEKTCAGRFIVMRASKGREVTNAD